MWKLSNLLSNHILDILYLLISLVVITYTPVQNSRYVIAVYGIRGRLNRLPAGCSGDMVLASVKKVN